MFLNSSLWQIQFIFSKCLITHFSCSAKLYREKILLGVECWFLCPPGSNVAEAQVTAYSPLHFPAMAELKERSCSKHRINQIGITERFWALNCKGTEQRKVRLGWSVQSMWIGESLQKDHGNVPGEGGSGAWAWVRVSEVQWDEELETISGHSETWRDGRSIDGDPLL